MGTQDGVTLSDYEYRQLRDAKTKADKLDGVSRAMRTLLEVLKNSLVALWWAIGLGGTVALWFYPAAANRMQPIVFGFVTVVYALISRALYKVKEVDERYSAV